MNNETYSLRHDGVEMVVYSKELHDEVKDAAECWQKFLMLPEEYLCLFESDNTQSGVGIEIKDGSGPNGDRKINFDYSHTGDRFDAILREKQNDTASSFIHSARVLENGIFDLSVIFAKKNNLPYDKLRPYIRFLYYPSGTPEGEIIAEPHTDHSGFTFHLYETTTGCEFLNYDNKWKQLPVSIGQAAAFVGMQSQYISKGEIKAICHKVMANTVSQFAGRIAIVCFVAFADIPRYNKRKYGRLQEMEPGFNYQMNPADFSELFSD